MTKCDIEVLLKNFNLDYVGKMHIRTMEKLTAFKDLVSKKNGRLIYKHIAILDLNGFGRKHMSSD